MVKLTKKDDAKFKSRKHDIVVSNKSIKETVHLHAGGYFDNIPPVPVGTRAAWNLPSAERNDLIKEGYRLWKYDPIAGTIVSLTTFFVLGRGLNFQFDDPEAQRYANKFWDKNNMEMRLRAASDELTAYGEVFIWLRPKKYIIKYGGRKLWNMGDVQVTFIHPENITSKQCAEDDIGDVYTYTYEWLDVHGIPRVETIVDYSKYDFDIDGEKGCMIHIATNKGNNDPFGLSDLIRVKEWLDNYQEYLRDGVIINKLYRSPSYDISIEDADEAEIAAAASRYSGWRIGCNPVHNAKESWQILEFHGPNTSQENARRALLLIIAAGVGFAEYMLADGANANLASTKSQQLPVIKKFEDRQDIWNDTCHKILQFVVRSKIKFGNVKNLNIEYDEEGDSLDFKLTLEFPPIMRDTDKEVADTNKLAISNKYMSLSTAAARLGIDFDRETQLIMEDIDKVKKISEKLDSLKLDFSIVTQDGSTSKLELESQQKQIQNNKTEEN